MKIDTENPFYKLGSALVEADFEPLDLENAIYDEEHIDLQRKYASALAHILDLNEDTAGSPCKFHLIKIAKTEPKDWNDACEDTLMHCTNTLQSLDITPEKFAKIAGMSELALRTGTMPLALLSRASGLGLPLLGALGGGASWLIEKELAEDDVATETLKQQSKEYKYLAHELEKQLRAIYGYKSPAEIEEEKAKQDNLKALIEKAISEE